MTTEQVWPWAALLLLGATHGLNPGMGWLFAVATGLQEQSERAVWRAMGPLALGHTIAVGAAVAAAVMLGAVVPVGAMRWLVAGALVLSGIRMLMRHRHPRFGGMRMGARDLTIWSFLMATAHGAGLMAVPFALRVAPAADPHAGHGAHLQAITRASLLTLSPEQLAGLAATVVHTASYLLVTCALAALVYRKLGVSILRSAWINIDLIWAGALLLTGVVTVLV